MTKFNPNSPVALANAILEDYQSLGITLTVGNETIIPKEPGAQSFPTHPEIDVDKAYGSLVKLKP